MAAATQKSERDFWIEMSIREIRTQAHFAQLAYENICNKAAIPNMVYISHFDPANGVFTFVNQDFDLTQMFQESQRIKTLAEQWVKDLECGVIKPPFG